MFLVLHVPSSRNAFITGKYHWELGPGANLRSELFAEHISFIHLLKQQGYIIGRTTAKTWGPEELTAGLHSTVSILVVKPTKHLMNFWKIPRPKVHLFSFGLALKTLTESIKKVQG